MRFPRGSAFHFGAAAILIAALALRLIGLDKGIWLDEAATLRICGADSVRGWIQAWLADSHPPLYPILVTMWSRAGQSVPFLRVLSVVLGVAAVLAGMAWLKRISVRAALAAGLLLALSPIFVHYSQELRTYPLLVLVTLLSFHAASRVAEDPGDWRRSAALAVSLGAAALTHFVGAALVPAVAVYLLLAAADRRRLAARGPILALSLPLAVSVALQVAQSRYLGRFTAEWWMPPVSPELLWRVALRLVGLPAAPPDTASAIALAAPPVMAAIALVLIMASVPRGRWRRGLPLLAAALVYWGTLIIYSVAVMPVVWTHAALPGLVPFVGFVAVQADSPQDRRLRIVAMLAIVLAAGTGAAAWLATEAGRPVEPWQQAAGDAKGRWRIGDMAVFWPDYAERPFRFYFRGLPDGAMVTVRPVEDITTAVKRVDAALARAGERPARARLVIVTRADMITRRHASTFDHLVTALGERADRFAEVEILTITADAPIVPDLRAFAGRMSTAMDAAFGLPARIDTRAGYERRTYH